MMLLQNLSTSFLQSLPDAWVVHLVFSLVKGDKECLIVFICGSVIDGKCEHPFVALFVLNLSVTASVAMDCLARVKAFP